MDRSDITREELIAAIDLKEAANAKDPFMAHIQAPDKECLLQIVHTLNDEMQSERPEHSRLDKLICLKESFARGAHVMVSPEEEMWRNQLDDAVAMMDQTA